MDSRNLKVFILLIASISIFHPCGHSLAQQTLLFDVKQLADRSLHEVEKVLGKPSALTDDVFRNSRGSTYAAVRASYWDGAVEITYLEGGARYLTIWVQKLTGKYPAYSYPKDAWTLLGDLGIDRNTTADLSTPSVTRWRDFPGIYEITVFPTAEKTIWYARVSTSRIYQ